MIMASSVALKFDPSAENLRIYTAWIIPAVSGAELLPVKCDFKTGCSLITLRKPTVDDPPVSLGSALQLYM